MPRDIITIVIFSKINILIYKIIYKLNTTVEIQIMMYFPLKEYVVCALCRYIV